MFWVSHSNSAINPLLYMAFNRRFRCACLNVSIALLRSPFHAISACANHPSPQKSIPTEFRTNKQPARQREDRAFLWNLSLVPVKTVRVDCTKKLRCKSIDRKYLAKFLTSLVRKWKKEWSAMIVIPYLKYIDVKT